MNNAINGVLAIPASTRTTVTIAGKAPALALLAFGLIALYCVGFSTSATTHNATHDTRHASGFPCH